MHLQSPDDFWKYIYSVPTAVPCETFTVKYTNIAKPFYIIIFLSKLRAGIFIQVQRLLKMLKKFKKYLLQTMFNVPHIYKWCLIYRTTSLNTLYNEKCAEHNVKKQQIKNCFVFCAWKYARKTPNCDKSTTYY